MKTQRIEGKVGGLISVTVSMEQGSDEGFVTYGVLGGSPAAGGPLYKSMRKKSLK